MNCGKCRSPCWSRAPRSSTYWIVALTTIVTSHGSPTEVDGRFYLNDRGSFIPVSESTYHQQLAEQRGFTAVPAAFYLFAALYLYGSAHWWGQDKEQDSAT